MLEVVGKQYTTIKSVSAVASKVEVLGVRPAPVSRSSKHPGFSRRGAHSILFFFFFLRVFRLPNNRQEYIYFVTRKHIAQPCDSNMGRDAVLG